MKLRRALSLAALLVVAFPIIGQGMDDKEFKKKFVGTQNSWERRDLVKQLDPTDERSLNLLMKFVLKKQDWYMREAAIDVLAGAYNPGLIGQLEKMKDKDPVVAEAIAMAFGRSKNTERVPHLLSLVESKKWKVRRAAVIALGNVPDKRSVKPLIETWENEELFMVWVHILESLEKITHQKNLPTPQDWKDWWAVAEDAFEVKKAGAEEDVLAEEEKSGEVIKTRARGTNLSLRARGNGLPLLVLPDYGYEKDYLETYLRNLEDTNQILYMHLPGTIDFVDPPLENAPNAPKPYYPLDRIVEAFEEMQVELEKSGKIKGKFAILAHGLSCWIAMTYAAKHPKSVRRMILIAAHSGQKAASEGIDRLERRGQQDGDLELEHYAQSRSYDGQAGAYRYEAKGEDEGGALGRKSFTVKFFDTRDLEIGRIYGPIIQKQINETTIAMVPEAVRPMGGCFIPPFSLFKLDRVPTPTLIMQGTNSIETSDEDAKAIARHYGKNARVISFTSSSDMPFIEENEKFVEGIRKFLGGKRQKRDKD